MEPEQKSNGALVGLIIIIIILVVGGFYIWNNSKKERANLENMNQVSDTADIDPSELEKEIDGIDLESLDSDL